jgi:hypothetical protein
MTNISCSIVPVLVITKVASPALAVLDEGMSLKPPTSVSVTLTLGPPETTAAAVVVEDGAVVEEDEAVGDELEQASVAALAVRATTTMPARHWRMRSPFQVAD